jgi:IS1 family transposase
MGDYQVGHWFLRHGWYPVIPCFINDCDTYCQKKTYMTRREGEQYQIKTVLATAPRKTLCYYKSEERLKYLFDCY